MATSPLPGVLQPHVALDLVVVVVVVVVAAVGEKQVQQKTVPATLKTSPGFLQPVALSCFSVSFSIFALHGGKEEKKNLFGEKCHRQPMCNVGGRILSDPGDGCTEYESTRGGGL